MRSAAAITAGTKYDAITSDPLDPWVKGAAMLYTKEFFESAKAHLNPGGVVTIFAVEFALTGLVAGIVGTIALALIGPSVANIALAFGPPEYFALMFMGLSLVISLSGRALLKGLISMALGLGAALIGQDPLTGAARLTFGTVTLNAGVDFISVIVGLFAISEVMINVEQRVTAISRFDIGSWMPTWADIKQCLGPMIRCTGVGFFLGLLPGCAPSVTTFVAYDLEKRLSKHPERFGKGAIEGVAAPEAAACLSLVAHAAPDLPLDEVRRLDAQVAVLRPTGTRISLAGKAQALSVLYAGGDGDRDRRCGEARRSRQTSQTRVGWVAGQRSERSA